MIRDHLRRLVYRTGWLRFVYAVARSAVAAVRPNGAERSGGQIVRVQCDPGALYVYSDDAKGARYLAQGGSFRKTLPHRIWRLAAERSRVVVDVGSNYGEYLISLVDIPGVHKKRIYSFEPNERVAAAQRTALAESGLSPCVELREMGLSHVAGKTAMFLNHADSGASSLRFLDAINPAVRLRVKKQTVELSTLDDELGGNVGADELIAVKIDAEGHDFSVLAGALGVLGDAGRYFVMLETNGPTLKAGLRLLGAERLQDLLGPSFYVFYHDALHECSSIDDLSHHLEAASNNLDIFFSSDAAVLAHMAELADDRGVPASLPTRS